MRHVQRYCRNQIARKLDLAPHLLTPNLWAFLASTIPSLAQPSLSCSQRCLESENACPPLEIACKSHTRDKICPPTQTLSCMPLRAQGAAESNDSLKIAINDFKRIYLALLRTEEDTENTEKRFSSVIQRSAVSGAVSMHPIRRSGRYGVSSGTEYAQHPCRTFCTNEEACRQQYKKIF